MKMGQKLTLGFVGMAFLVVCVGFLSISTSQRVLRDRIGRASSLLADEIMHNVDKTLYSRIELFQEYAGSIHVQKALLTSNELFDGLSDVTAMMAEQDRHWIAAAPKQTTAFMLDIINNDLSRELRDKVRFYNSKCDYKVFGEVFITNQYGANVAQTGKTSDYCQADETWWQTAKLKGLHIGNVAYDESATVYSTDICLRIDDNDGHFQGVAKVALNIEESMALIHEAIGTDVATDFKLLNRDWRIIYALETCDFLAPLDESLLAHFQRCEKETGQSYFVAKGDRVGEGDELFGYAHSRGYKDFQGLGWILAIEQETKDIFAPVQKLKVQILTASLIISVLAIAIGLIISRSICCSLENLTRAAREIGQGNLDVRVDVASQDEIGFLARAFNAMVRDLAEITTSKESLSREVTLHKQTEMELRSTKTKLEKQLSELSLVQDAALNMMEDICNENAERKQAETMLERAKKEAESANEAKSQFLANMSHEVRTPMNAIIGFSDILINEPVTEQQRHYINTIRNSGKYLLQVINDILDFSKIEAGKMNIIMGRGLLNHLFCMIESIMHALAQEKGIQFKIRTAEDLPAHMVTDSERLQQCLLNLINNAIKFTEAGHVFVNVYLEQRDSASFIRFDIEDTGIGIPVDKQDDVFRSFSQADGSISRKYGGTGLGLAITKQLTHLMGGELTLSSEPGKGSTFSLIMPAGLDVTKGPRLDRQQLVEHTPAPQKKQAEPELSGHILVAEDVKANQMLVKIMLERMNLEVTIVEDGNQVIHAALAFPFDLILMDIQMPNMGGHEATRTLRRSGLKTPIIALTAHAMRGDIDKCLASGCDGYLSKPISAEKLTATIAPYLRCQESDREAASGNIPIAPKENTSMDTHQSPSSKADQTVRPGPDEVVDCLFNWDHLISRLGDEETVREIMPCYLQDNQNRINLLTDAVTNNDARQIAQYAHALKGAAANFGAERMAQIARQLEQAGRKEDLDRASSLFEDLRLELSQLFAFLSREDWIDVAKRDKMVTAETLSVSG